MIFNKKSGMWKVQLTVAINSTFSKDVNQERLILLKSHNEEFMIHDNENDIVDKLFK